MLTPIQKIIHRLPLALLALLLLNGCAFMPGQGPSKIYIALQEDEAQDITVDYALLDLDAPVVRHLGALPRAALSDTFSTQIKGTAPVVLGMGDRLLINIWEPSADGLFSTADKKETQIDVKVDEEGKIYIPYLGRLPVAGKNVEQVRQAIEQGLQGKAVEPQVQLILTTNGGHNIAILGDVTQPGRFDVPTSGLRLIEALAKAGGTRQPSFETEITVTRGDVSSTVWLDEVMRDQRNNVWLQPRDTVHVLHRPRSFTAFGAVRTQSHVPFKTESLSLAEALAQSGGLHDSFADAGGVFLFRFEPQDRLEQAGYARNATAFGEGIPTIYRLDFKKPQSFLMARSFMMQDKDIIYVANAPGAELRKFVTTILSPLLVSSRSLLNLEP